MRWILSNTRPPTAKTYQRIGHASRNEDVAGRTAYKPHGRYRFELIEVVELWGLQDCDEQGDPTTWLGAGGNSMSQLPYTQVAGTYCRKQEPTS
jgi:hypothetical protein